MTKAAWELDFSTISKHELREVDQKVDDEVSKIDLMDWAARLLTVGALWALWERLGKPVKKNMEALSGARIRREHVMGKVSPGGALARVENINDVLPFNPMQKNALKFATQHAAEHLQKISDQTRTEVRLAILRARQQGTHPKDLAAQLRKTFKGLDRDWRRVAVTESAYIANNGYLMSQPEGAMVIGSSAADCCRWCREIISGKIYVITHNPPSSLSDPRFLTHVWVGKNNVGRVRHVRAANGRKRAPSELWTPCCPLHSHCRCTWSSYTARKI